MTRRDEGKREVEFSVVVFGGATDTFFGALPLKDGALPLGQVQGWATRVTFHPFGVDPWADAAEGERLMALLSSADGLLLTDAPEQGRHYVSSALERLERAMHLTRPNMPTVVFGGVALAEEWASLTGVKPLFACEPTADHAMSAVKALARSLFRPSSRPPPV